MRHFANLKYISTEISPAVICRRCNKPLLYPILCTKCEFYTCKWCLNASSCCDTTTTCDVLEMNGRGQLQVCLDALQVYCPLNNSNGCRWNGSRAELIRHYDQCINTKIDCVFGCGDMVSIDDVDHLESCIKFTNCDDNRVILTKRYFTKRQIITEYSHLFTDAKLIKQQSNIDDLQLQLTKYKSKIAKLKLQLNTYSDTKSNSDTIIVDKPLFTNVADYYRENKPNIFRINGKCHIKLAIFKLVLPNIQAEWSIKYQIDSIILKNFPTFVNNGIRLISIEKYDQDYESTFKFNIYDTNMESDRTFSIEINYMVDDYSDLKYPSSRKKYNLDCGLTRITARRIS